MEWQLEIAFHWPHDRLALGWEVMHADEKYNFDTYVLYVGIMTITLDVWK
jgi:hypothetical protein